MSQQVNPAPRLLAAALVAAALAACVPHAAGAQPAPSAAGPGADSTAAVPEVTRTARLIETRRQKLQALEEPEDGAFERAVAWIEEKRDALRYGSGEPRLLHLSPVLGGLRSGAGETAGVKLGLARDNPGRMLTLAARASLKRYWGVAAEAGLRTAPFFHFAFAQFRHMPRESFYGLGHGADAVETSFRHDEFVGGVLTGLQVTPRFVLGAQAAYMINDVGAGAAPDLPTTGEHFSASGVPGLGHDVDYGIYGVFLELDYRQHDLERDYGERFAPTERRLRGLSLDARRGVYFAVEANHYTDRTAGAFSFTRFDVDAHQYVPIRGGFQVLALRQLLTLSDVDPGDDVPFYLMETVGGKRTIRGFDEHRFRDLNAIVLNAEYRYQVWVLLDLALFADAGQVFRDVDQVSLDRMEVGYGVGLRFKTPEALFARIDLAHSREGFAVELSLGSIL